jgi:hypothetical protein
MYVGEERPEGVSAECGALRLKTTAVSRPIALKRFITYQPFVDTTG